MRHLTLGFSPVQGKLVSREVSLIIVERIKINMNATPLLSGRSISKIYRDADDQIEILKTVDIDVFKSEMLAILGASGSGKSTLLHILGTLDVPSSGKVIFQNQDLMGLSDKRKAEFRNKQLGFVYQFHHLLPEFSALENVAMPQLIARKNKDNAMEEAEHLLRRVGLSNRLSHKPQQLSGGERQRVAIARALINQPSVIMADEPTGNLDLASSAEILALIKDINKTEKTSFIIVTHDHSLAKEMDRILTLKNGQFQV